MEKAKYCGLLAYYKYSDLIYIPVFAGSKKSQYWISSK